MIIRKKEGNLRKEWFISWEGFGYFESSGPSLSGSGGQSSIDDLLRYTSIKKVNELQKELPSEIQDFPKLLEILLSEIEKEQKINPTSQKLQESISKKGKILKLIESTKNKAYFLGEWLSAELTEIPNYNNNSSNWVDCTYILGKLRLSFEEVDENIKFEVGAPVLFNRADKGYLTIYGGDVEIKYETITFPENPNIKMKYEKRSPDEFSLKLFEEEFLFSKIL